MRRVLKVPAEGARGVGGDGAEEAFAAGERRHRRRRESTGGDFAGSVFCVASVPADDFLLPSCVDGAEEPV